MLALGPFRVTPHHRSAMIATICFIPAGWHEGHLDLAGRSVFYRRSDGPSDAELAHVITSWLGDEPVTADPDQPGETRVITVTRE